MRIVVVYLAGVVSGMLVIAVWLNMDLPFILGSLLGR
jgi:hypothetical protein